MKLLLTSQGITNDLIAGALADLVGKSPYDTKVAIIPTARNAEPPSRGRFVGQFFELYKHGYDWLDIVDPSAADVAWERRLREADVIFVSGGNTFHLLNQARITGLDRWLRDNLKNKVYVGVSAGSIIATPTIEVASIPPRDNNIPGLTDLSGLNFVDFEIEPHCDQARFLTLENYAKNRPHPLYALDDQSAVRVEDRKVQVISRGFWKVFKGKSNTNT